MKSSGKYIRFPFCVIILLLTFIFVRAQEKTEVFIPLGKSPGISGKFSVIGKIERIDLKDSVITIRDGQSIKTIRIMAATEIYLDKSRVKQTNQKGSISNCKTGMMAEAKYVNNQPGNSCEWLKLQIE